MATPTAIVGYLALFVLVGSVFLFANLLIGYFIRPSKPNEEKLEIYECGEPTVGSSFVQFDLRFYVVALLFIIFDVEVAFFFPWATVFGKASELTAPTAPIVASDLADYDAPATQLTPFATQKLRELGVEQPTSPLLSADEAQKMGLSTDLAGQTKAATQQMAEHIVWTSLIDIGVFFAVLLVGFAYVWKRGDLDWVRSVSSASNLPVVSASQAA